MQNVECNLEHTVSPVTALCVVGNVLLAGQGHHITIYSLHEHERVGREIVFDSQEIHGIVTTGTSPEGEIVLVWGGCLLRLFTLQCREDRYEFTQLSGALKSPDWLLHAAFAPYSTASGRRGAANAAVITAHNALLDLCLDVGNGGSPSVRLVQLSAATRRLLYAAHVCWLGDKHVLVAVGSAFGELTVWSYFFDNTKTRVAGCAKVNSHILAHEGSIFSVDLHQNIWSKENNLPELLVCTCSDDRTIKVWDLSNIIKDKQTDTIIRSSPSNESLPEDPSTSVVNMNNLAQEPFAKTWAHNSRIWHVRVILSPDASELGLLSFGEDATFHYWTVTRKSLGSGDMLPRGILVETGTFSHHSGKNIWAFSAPQTPESTSQVVTGGADGGIVRVPLLHALVTGSEKIRRSIEFGEIDWSSQQDGLSMRGEDAFHSSDGFRNYSFVGEDALLLTTNHGKVLLCIFVTGESQEGGSMRSLVGSLGEWQLLGSFSDLTSYSIVAGLPVLHIGFVGSKNGSIYCYCGGKIWPFLSLQSGRKISGIFLQSLSSASGTHNLDIEREASPHSSSFGMLVTMLGVGFARLFVFNAPPLPLSDAKAFTHHVDLPDGHVVTCARLIHAPSDILILFTGARNGTICVYEVRGFPEERTEQSGRQKHPAHKINPCSITTAHDDAITNMIWLQDEPVADESASGSLLTTSRDGTFAVHHYWINGPKHAWNLVHRARPQFGPNIEGVQYDEQSGKLKLWGFKSTNFIVFDQTNNCEMQNVYCGGAHRTWAFLPQQSASNDNSVGDLFMWTKASRLNGHRQCRENLSVLQASGHGREIKTCAVRPRQATDGLESPRIVATGAEDTDIRLWSCARSKPGRRWVDSKCISIIRKHKTGVQHLQWSQDGAYLFSCAGSEEFYVWKIRHVPFVTVGVVCEATLPRASTLLDLRITNFDVMQSHDGGQSRSEPDFLFCVAFSDSTIRLYQYTSLSSEHDFDIKCAGRYNTSCLTSINFLLSSTPFRRNNNPHDNSFHNFVTSATDGKLAIWDVSTMQQSHLEPNDLVNIRPSSVFKIHQNTIKSSNTILLNHSFAKAHNRDYLMVTVGDDSAMAFTRLTDDEIEGDKLQVETLLIPKAHAAAVNAVEAVLIPETGGAEPKHILVVTASNDQRLKAWEVTIDTGRSGIEGLDVTKVSDVFSPVADAACMDVLEISTETTADSSGSISAEVRILLCGVGMDIWNFRFNL